MVIHTRKVTAFFNLLAVNELFWHIASYLNPNYAYNLSTSSTTLSRNPSLTYDNVVEYALITRSHGAVRKQILESIYHSLLRQTIFIPSPLRILYLICTFPCECCHTRRWSLMTPFGMGWCWLCRVQNTQCVTTGPDRHLSMPISKKDILQCGHIALKDGKWEHENKNDMSPCSVHSQFIVDEHYFDDFGRKIGPLLSLRDIFTMMHMETIYHVQDYIKKRVPPETGKTHKFFDAIQKYRPLYAHKIRQEEILKKARMRYSHYRKLFNVKKVIEMIKRELPPHRRHMLSHYEDPMYVYATNNLLEWHEVCIVFTMTWVDTYLKPMVRTPTKYNTKKGARQIAHEMLRIYEENYVDHA